MRVLIINLTRFGDLLQTQPLIHELHEQGHSVGLVCLENFLSAAALITDVDWCVSLPGSRLLNSLDSDWRLGCGVLDAFAQHIHTTFAPDEVLNLTASLAGRLLARRLVRHGVLTCFGVDAHGFGTNSSLWSSFFEASTRLRGCSPYNIVDTFRKAAGQGRGSARFTLRAPDSGLYAQTVASLRAEAPCEGFVALQLGASETRRQWPVLSFAQLGQRLFDELGLMPVLLGTKAERALAEAYLSTHSPAVDCVGRTDLPELAATLCASRLLVTNDTGTMHLAAGLGVPSLAIFLATAQPWDTGPYLADCCCLEPDLACHPCGFGTVCPHDERCRIHITVDSVWELVRHRMCTGHWPDATALSTGLPGTARVWRTVWEGDTHGATRMNLESLSGHEHATRTLLLRLQRHFYCQFLDLMDTEQWDSDNAVLLRECVFVTPPAYLVTHLAEDVRKNMCATLEQVEDLLHLLQEQGKVIGVMPKAGQRFLSTVHTMANVLDNSLAFNALGRLWLATAQEKGGQLSQFLSFAYRFSVFIRAWRLAL